MTNANLDQIINWEVQQRNLFLGAQIGVAGPEPLNTTSIPDFKAIINGSTNEVLNMPKNGYAPLSNASLMQAAEMMAQASQGTVEGYQTFKGGKKVLAYVKAGEHISKINGNAIEDYIVLGNSHDGSSSVFIGTSTMLLRCENQFAEIQREFNIRHSGNMEFKFEEAMAHYRAYYKQRDQMYQKFTKMSTIKLDTGLVASLTDRLFDVDRQAILQGEKEMSTQKFNQVESFRDSLETEMGDLGSNMWGFFNAVTHYTTHSRGKGGKSHEENNSFGNVVGSNANFNKKAMGIITRPELITG